MVDIASPGGGGTPPLSPERHPPSPDSDNERAVGECLLMLSSSPFTSPTRMPRKTSEEATPRRTWGASALELTPVSKMLRSSPMGSPMRSPETYRFLNANYSPCLPSLLSPATLDLGLSGSGLEGLRGARGAGGAAGLGPLPFSTPEVPSRHALNAATAGGGSSVSNPTAKKATKLSFGKDAPQDASSAATDSAAAWALIGLPGADFSLILPSSPDRGNSSGAGSSGDSSSASAAVKSAEGGFIATGGDGLADGKASDADKMVAVKLEAVHGDASVAAAAAAAAPAPSEGMFRSAGGVGSGDSGKVKAPSSPLPPTPSDDELKGLKGLLGAVSRLETPGGGGGGGGRHDGSTASDTECLSWDGLDDYDGSGDTADAGGREEEYDEEYDEAEERRNGGDYGRGRSGGGGGRKGRAAGSGSCRPEVAKTPSKRKPKARERAAPRRRGKPLDSTFLDDGELFSFHETPASPPRSRRAAEAAPAAAAAAAMGEAAATGQLAEDALAFSFSPLRSQRQSSSQTRSTTRGLAVVGGGRGGSGERPSPRKPSAAAAAAAAAARTPSRHSPGTPAKPRKVSRSKRSASIDSSEAGSAVSAAAAASAFAGSAGKSRNGFMTPAAAARRGSAAVPGISPAGRTADDGGERPAGTGPCNCKKSRCLKLYCDCFARQLFCEDCRCVDCCNVADAGDEREEAVRSLLVRNPMAFKTKQGKATHTAGCNCKKSACLKKYCTCFEAGGVCSAACHCAGCRNLPGDALRATRLASAGIADAALVLTAGGAAADAVAAVGDAGGGVMLGNGSSAIVDAATTSGATPMDVEERDALPAPALGAFPGAAAAAAAAAAGEGDEEGKVAGAKRSADKALLPTLEESSGTATVAAAPRASATKASAADGEMTDVSASADAAALPADAAAASAAAALPGGRRVRRKTINAGSEAFGGKTALGGRFPELTRGVGLNFLTFLGSEDVFNASLVGRAWDGLCMDRALWEA